MYSEASWESLEKSLYTSTIAQVVYNEGRCLAKQSLSLKIAPPPVPANRSTVGASTWGPYSLVGLRSAYETFLLSESLGRSLSMLELRGSEALLVFRRPPEAVGMRAPFCDSSSIVAAKRLLHDHKAWRVVLCWLGSWPPSRLTQVWVSWTAMAAFDEEQRRAPVGLVWFKSTDLRLLDHQALVAAHHENPAVLHAFCFDPRSFSPAGIPEAMNNKTGSHRTRFMLEGVRCLKDKLRSLGRDLLIVRGRPEAELPALARAYGVTTVYCHR
jgi:hypothetical protein